MKQKNEKVSISDIETFWDHFINLPTILYLLKQKIGTLDNKSLASSVFSENLETKKRGTINIKSVFNKTDYVAETINGSWYIADKEFLVPGVNQHLKNKPLLISVAPEKVDTNLGSAFSLNSTVDKSSYITIGENQVSKTINRIANLHPEKPITYLVLGNAINDPKAGNFEVYAKLLENAHDEAEANDSHILKFRLSKTAHDVNFPRDEDITIFYLHAHENRMLITSSGINFIYDFIYKDTIKKGNPLLIQDDQGLNTAPKFAFALELLRNIDSLLKKEDNYKIRDEIINHLGDLKRSRAENALDDIVDFNQAIYLAFALKMYEMEHNILYQINELLVKNNTNKAFESKAAQIREVIRKVLIKSDYAEKAKTLNCELINTKELQPSFSFLSFGEPEHYTLLKTLRYVFEIRAKVEQIVLPFFAEGVIPEIQSENGHDNGVSKMELSPVDFDYMGSEDDKPNVGLTK